MRPRTTNVLFTRDLRVHEPWRLEAAERRRLDYPDPIVDHGEAAAAFHRRRRRAS